MFVTSFFSEYCLICLSECAMSNLINFAINTPFPKAISTSSTSGQPTVPSQISDADNIMPIELPFGFKTPQIRQLVKTMLSIHFYHVCGVWLDADNIPHPRTGVLLPRPREIIGGKYADFFKNELPHVRENGVYPVLTISTDSFSSSVKRSAQLAFAISRVSETAVDYTHVLAIYAQSADSKPRAHSIDLLKTIKCLETSTSSSSSASSSTTTPTPKHEKLFDLDFLVSTMMDFLVGPQTTTTNSNNNTSSSQGSSVVHTLADILQPHSSDIFHVELTCRGHLPQMHVKKAKGKTPPTKRQKTTDTTE
jgi:hypothetical protein